MTIRKQLVRLANKVQSAWKQVDFMQSPIHLNAGWYICEFMLAGSLPQTPRIVVEDDNAKLIERELIGYHAGRNRMLVYLPEGRLHSVSEAIEFTQLARLPFWEARARVLLICGRYLVDFFNPITLCKIIFMQFRSPFNLSTQLLGFYMPRSETVGHLAVHDFYRKYPQLTALLSWWYRKIRIGVMVENDAQRKELLELRVPPESIWLAGDDSLIDLGVDYVLPLSQREHLRDVSLLLFKRAIAKRLHHTGSLPSLVYSDHDYNFDQERGDKVMLPVFKPAPSAAYLHCFAYLGPAVLYQVNVVERGSLSTLMNEQSCYKAQLELFKNLDRVCHIDEVLVSSDRQTELQTPAAHSQQSSWPDINWQLNPRTDIPTSNVLVAADNWLQHPGVDLVIPTRDGLDVLKPCIDSILEKTSYKNYNIIVVDNGSEQAETLRYFEQITKLSNVKLVHYPGEFNYSAINNFAVAQGKSDYVGLINNDIEVIDGDWLTQLMVWAKQPEVGAVGAKLLFGNGLVQHAGVIVGMGNAAGHIHRLEARDSAGYQHRCIATQNLTAVTAACLITPRALFNQLGGLNEDRLKVAYNDIDYCLRVRELGRQVIWTPEAELYHHESVSRGDDLSDQHISRYFKELGYFQKRWKSKGYNDPFYSRHLRISDEAVYPKIDVQGKDRLRYL